MAKDATKIAAKWRARMQASSQDMADGVNAVTTAPGQMAKAKQDTMKARLIAAIDSGKWAANVSAVPLSEWQDAMIKKGVPRAQEGASQAEPKVQQFMAELLPFTESVKRQIAAMPNATEADRRARMNKAFDLMKTFKRTRR